MKCPSCESDNTEITGTRDFYESVILRYRRCLDCGVSFKTVQKREEVIQVKVSLSCTDFHK